MDERSYRRLLREAAWRFTSFAIPFLTDVAIGSLIFVALLWFAWLLGLGKAVGLKQEQVEALELAHFWINYGIYIGVGLSFLFRTLKPLFRGD